MTLLCAALAWGRPLAADSLYDVGSNTTFATFNAAFAQALADQPGPFGVTVRVRVLDANPGPLLLDGGLLPLQPQPAHGLVVEPGPGYAPVLSGAGAYGVRVSGVANVTVQGLGVQGFSVGSVRLDNAANAVLASLRLNGAGAGAVEAHGCANLTLSDSLLAPAAGTGALVDNCPGALVKGNLVPASAAPSYGVVLQASDQAWLRDNRADNANYAFNVFSCAGVTVTANVAIGRTKQRGLVLDNSNGTLITRNLLVGQIGGMELQSSQACAVYQNTVWEHSTAALIVGTGSTGMTVRNNLWGGYFDYFLNGAAQASFSSNNNGFQFDGQMGVGLSSYPSLSDWQATGQDATALDADPLFAGLLGTQPEDYKLKPGSPMLGYGADLGPTVPTDYFGNALGGGQPWDPGFHVLSVPQNTPTVSPTPTPVLPTATPTPTASPTISPTFTPSPIGTATRTPTTSPTPTITPTYTLTPYPFQRDRVLSYPNPWSPASGSPLNIVFEPGERATVRLFDMAGELVTELPPEKVQAELGHALWDGRDRGNSLVPSGLYLAVVNTPKGTRFVRFTVLY